MVNTEIRESNTAKSIEKDILDRHESKKLKPKHIKDFLTKYYEGDPEMPCPTGCKQDCQLTCYIEIHKALVDDEDNKVDFEVPYVRDGEQHCCGMEMSQLDNDNIFCTICGNEYEG